MDKNPEFEFPKNPFEDVKPSEFNKLNKKHVTEDFVEENFINLGWEVFRPFNDTGVDRIITKTVCPKGHTLLTENLKNNKCSHCQSVGIEIVRFIQVKTRQLKKNIFGFTLKSKDIRIDPRHVYLLYSDRTTIEKQDFLIVPVKDFLSFFTINLINPFSPTSFRKGNNKLNSLRYIKEKDSWSWGKGIWDHFRNIEGLKKLQSPEIDLNLDKEIVETRQLADKLQRKFSCGRSYSYNSEEIINKILELNLKNYSNKKDILKIRKDVKNYLEKECDKETFESMNKYLEFIKIIEIIGGDEENE